MRQGTAACRGFGLAILRKRLFLYRQSSPGAGYIQRRFSAASVGYAHFEQSVTAFAALFSRRLTHPGSPPPFISLRTLRSLRFKISSAADTAAIQRDGVQSAQFLNAFSIIFSIFFAICSHKPL